MVKAMGENQIIEIEADSLKAARAEARSRVPEGLQMISEKIVSDGKTESEKGIDETVEAALAAARKRIPEGVKIIEERTIMQPSWNSFEVEAFDNDSAAQAVKRKMSKTARIEKMELKTAGRTGFLGIGRTPHHYQAKVFQPAVVQVQYKFLVKIRVEYGEHEGQTYHNGDVVDCGHCGRSIRVEYQDGAKHGGRIWLVDPQVIQSISLRCQACGFVVCFTCANPSGEGLPVCPSCQTQGGPSFFVH